MTRNSNMDTTTDIKLSKMQLILAEEYLKTGNILQSAITAGYSPKTAQVTGLQALNRPKVQAYIRERKKQMDKDLIASTDEVLSYLSRVMRGQEKDAFGLDPSLSDRTSAAKELAKRLVDRDGMEGGIIIVNNIPRSNENG